MAKYTGTIHLQPEPGGDRPVVRAQCSARGAPHMQEGKRASTSSSGRQYLHRAGGSGDGVNPPDHALSGPRSFRAHVSASTRSGRAQGQGRGVHQAAHHCAAGRARLLHPRAEGVSIELLDRNAA